MTLSKYGRRYSFYIFISITVTFFTITTAECPPPTLIKPCNCDDNPFPLVDCEGITDLETLVRVFNRTADRKFHSFALHESSIQYLPSSAISTKRFEQIFLMNVRMAGMFDKRPDPSNNISMITIMGSTFLKGIGWENFGTMTKLQIIAIHDTEVKSLGKSFVDNVPGSVKRFQLYNSRVRKLQYNAFSHMKDLYDIQVQQAEIKFLRRSLFSTPSKLRNFVFPDNQIDSLPDDLFTEMPDIENINLSGNRISIISEAVFGNIYNNIKELKMENNPVVCDCSLKWYLSRYRGTLKGSCGGPEDRAGKSFHNLTPRDFSYCT